MSWIDILTESTAALAPSGNPLEILPPRERAAPATGRSLPCTPLRRRLSPT